MTKFALHQVHVGKVGEGEITCATPEEERAELQALADELNLLVDLDNADRPNWTWLAPRRP